MTVRTAGLTAGAGILLIAVLAGFGNFVALEGLVTDGDARRTAEDIAASEGLFRAGVAGLFLVIALDVVVAWALYRVFGPVDRHLSLLGAVFRLVFAGVFLAAVGELLGVVRLLDDDGYRAVFGADQLDAQVLLGIDAFTDLWLVALGLFGLHLIVIGYLAYRSGSLPRVLGVLLAVAGLGYLADSLGVVLAADSWTGVSTVTFVGELLLALWLLARSRRLAS